MTQGAYLSSETPSGMWSTITSITSFPPKKQTNIQHTSEPRSFFTIPGQRQALENRKNTGTVVLSFYFAHCTGKVQNQLLLPLYFYTQKFQNISKFAAQLAIGSCLPFWRVLIFVWQIIRHSALKNNLVFQKGNSTPPTPQFSFLTVCSIFLNVEKSLQTSVK